MGSYLEKYLREIVLKIFCLSLDDILSQYKVTVYNRVRKNGVFGCYYFFLLWHFTNNVKTKNEFGHFKEKRYRNYR